MNRLLSRTVLALLLLGGTASAQRVEISQQLVFTPYRAGGIYDVGDTIGWTVSSGPATLAYAYKWTIRRNNAVVLKEGKLGSFLRNGQDRDRRRSTRHDLCRC
jgi:hypothetical protein